MEKPERKLLFGPLKIALLLAILGAVYYGLGGNGKFRPGGDIRSWGQILDRFLLNLVTFVPCAYLVDFFIRVTRRK